MTTLEEATGVPQRVLDGIREVESGGNPRVMRFETRLFRERTGQTVQGSTRAAFESAFLIDKRAAVESSSWGEYQVLGGTGIRLYGTPAAFLQAFEADPAGVSRRLVIEYFRRRPQAVAAANAGDWVRLTRLYNNSGEGSRWHRRFLEAIGETGASGSSSTAGGGSSVFGVAAVLALVGLAAWGGWRWLRRRAR